MLFQIEIRLQIMKNLIWVTSYPKSGNTWMRYLLANYFYNQSGLFDPKIIKHIDRLKLPKNMSMFNDEGKISINKISKNWIPAQEKLQSNQVKFIKNHGANLTINDNQFTNEELTCGIILIVRDPRDVIISGLNYWNLDNYDEMIEKICDEEFLTIYQKEQPHKIEVIGSWKVNFLSWYSGLKKVPKIIIRYEDMIKNTEEQLFRVLNFLSHLFNFEINKEKILFSVENSNFKKLSEAESNGDFIEDVQKKGKFFRKGKIGQYHAELNKFQIKKIEDAFHREMRFLDYL